MCRICTEWELGKLTANEAKRNAMELASFPADPEEYKHALQVWQRAVWEDEDEDQDQPDTDRMD